MRKNSKNVVEFQDESLNKNFNHKPLLSPHIAGTCYTARMSQIFTSFRVRIQAHEEEKNLNI